MIKILPYINAWFFAKQSYLEAFSKNDSRLEGWFKGELFLLFDILKQQNVIIEFEREFKYTVDKTTRIDFRLNLNNSENFLELKSLCISQSKGTPRNLQFYFREDHVGLIKDFRKFELMNLDHKWILGFIYPKPAIELWNQVCSTIPIEFSHWQCISNINEYPDFLFISLWKSNN
jgi:hypothetical protein